MTLFAYQEDNFARAFNMKTGPKNWSLNELGMIKRQSSATNNSSQKTPQDSHESPVSSPGSDDDLFVNIKNNLADLDSSPEAATDFLQ